MPPAWSPTCGRKAYRASRCSPAITTPRRRRPDSQLGVDDVRSGQLPEDKVTAIEFLRGAHGAIAMVGDGVNDAPALAAADVGIVMGAMGSDAALETADIALMTDELSKVPYTIRLSHATLAQHSRQRGDLDRAQGARS